MKAEIVNVTPMKALEWLKANTDNRPLRRSVVNGFKYAMQRGEYIATHQGIAFAADGTLLDGQHRLTAISEMRDGSFPMLVTWGLAKEAFRVMDIGIKRTASDSLKEDRRLVEVARLIASICDTKRGTITPTMLIPIIDRIQGTHEALVAFAPRQVRTWSSASLRTAAVVSVLTHVDFDYVKTIYRALVVGDFTAMPPVAHALVRAVGNGTARATDVLDMYARGMVVFNPHNAQLSKIQVKDTSKAVSILRQRFADITFAADESYLEKKKATDGTVAKGGLPINYSSMPAGR